MSIKGLPTIDAVREDRAGTRPVLTTAHLRWPPRRVDRRAPARSSAARRPRLQRWACEVQPPPLPPQLPPLGPAGCWPRQWLGQRARVGQFPRLLHCVPCGQAGVLAPAAKAVSSYCLLWTCKGQTSTYCLLWTRKGQPGLLVKTMRRLQASCSTSMAGVKRKLAQL